MSVETQRLAAVRALRFAEWVFAAASLFLFSEVRRDGPRLARALGIVPPQEGPDLLLCGIGAVAAVVLLASRGWIKTAWSRAWPIFALLGMAVCSLVWAVDPWLSANRLLTFASATTFGVFLALRFRLEDQIRLLALSLGLIALASIAVVLWRPDYAILPAHGWIGIFAWKNYLGRTMALGALALAFLVFPLRRMSVIPALGAALCVVLLVGSRSRSSQFVVLVLCLIAAVFAWIGPLPDDRRRRALKAIAAAAGAAVLFAWVERDFLLSLFTYGDTLNARTPMWSMLIEKASARPWLGYGYGSFWRGKLGPSGEVAAALHFYPNHAHNGFLEIVLDLGAIGLLLFCGPLLGYVRAALPHAMAPRSWADLWPAMFLGFLVLINLTYSELMWSPIHWALYVAVVLSLGSSLADTGRAQ